MNFGLKTKHSFSNKYFIDARNSFNSSEFVAFKLSNNNEIYFLDTELTERYSLTQNAKQVRNEIKHLIIKDLNKELGFEDPKIVDYVPVTGTIDGYLLPHCEPKAYIKNIDDSVGELFFDKVNDITGEINSLEYVICELDLFVGTCQLSLSSIQLGKIFKFNSRFKAFLENKALFDFSLGLKEIIVLKEKHGMSLEDEVGDPILSNKNIALDITISLGKLEFTITQLQELLVGDFIDISSLNFPNVELQYKNRRIAVAELVYNEQKELSIEIKEVLIK